MSAWSIAAWLFGVAGTLGLLAMGLNPQWATPQMAYRVAHLSFVCLAAGLFIAVYASRASLGHWFGVWGARGAFFIALGILLLVYGFVFSQRQQGTLNIRIRPQGYPEVYLTSRAHEDSSAIPELDVIVLPNLTILARDDRHLELRFHLEIQTSEDHYTVINEPDVGEFSGWKAERLKRTNNEATFLSQPLIIDGPGTVRGDLAFTTGMGFRYGLQESTYWKSGRFNLSLYVWDELSDRKAKIQLGWLLTSNFYDARP